MAVNYWVGYCIDSRRVVAYVCHAIQRSQLRDSLRWRECLQSGWIGRWRYYLQYVCVWILYILYSAAWTNPNGSLLYHPPIK